MAKRVDLNFDRYFADGWRIFKQVTYMIAGVTFLLAIPIVIVYFLMFFSMLGITSFEQYLDIAKHDPYYFQRISRAPRYLVTQSIFVLAISLVSAPITAGLIKMCRDVDKDGSTSFGAAFYYFKGRYFMKVVVITLIMSFAQQAANLAFGFIPVLGSFMYLGAAVLMYILFAFSITLVIFADASISQAISLSFKLASKNFWAILAYSLLFGLLAGAGIIACCIGIFFSIAFVYVNQYLLYKYVVGFPEDEAAIEEPGSWQQQPPTM